MKQGLQVRGLWASYRRGPEVVRGVDLDAARGSITALLGPNGFTNGVGPANLGLSFNINM